MPHISKVGQCKLSLSIAHIDGVSDVSTRHERPEDLCNNEGASVNLYHDNIPTPGLTSGTCINNHILPTFIGSFPEVVISDIWSTIINSF